MVAVTVMRVLLFVLHVCGTRCSCIVSSAADVLLVSVERGMRGVGGVCEKCMCLTRGGVG